MTRLHRRVLAAPDTFLTRPNVRVYRMKGRIYGIAVKLRITGTKWAFGVTPDPSSPVRFRVDREGQPFAIDLDYPVEGGEFLRILRLFLAGVDWDIRARAPLRLDPGVMDLLLRGFEKAVPVMRSWRAALPQGRRRRISA